MARTALRIFVDLAVFALAACGAAAAFGVVGSFTILRSVLPGKPADKSLARLWHQALRVLVFIYNHSGLPQAFAPVSRMISRIIIRPPR